MPFLGDFFRFNKKCRIRYYIAELKRGDASIVIGDICVKFW